MHKMNWVAGPHNSLSRGTILRFKYVYGNRLTEEKTNKILIFRNHIHLMKFLQLKLLEAGKCLEKYHV